jgi:hypothetical protein
MRNSPEQDPNRRFVFGPDEAEQSGACGQGEIAEAERRVAINLKGTFVPVTQDRTYFHSARDAANLQAA